MLKVALTGGIACGKSVVGAMLVRRGIPVCDADDLAHGVLEPGREAYGAVVAAFGEGVLTPEGRIDRRRLAEAVFRDAARRERLNRIVHPVVRRLWGAWLEEQERLFPGRRRAPAVVVAPLLYEAGLGSGWDAVVGVVCSESAQVARLRRRGHGSEEIRDRLAAQMGTAEKALAADYVIWNEGSEGLLEAQVRKVFRHIEGS